METSAQMASRTIGYALIGAPPKASMIELAFRALEVAPEFRGADVSLAQNVLTHMSRGLMPSQRICIAARSQLEDLRLASRDRMRAEQAEQDATTPAHPAPRG